MEKRRLGKTGHMGTILTLGGAALGTVTQAEADAAIAMARERGINHLDVVQWTFNVLWWAKVQNRNQQ